MTVPSRSPAARTSSPDSPAPVLRRWSLLLSTLALAAAAALLVASPARGQESIQFAPRLGATIATVQSDTASNTASKTSIVGGVAMRVGLPGPVSLQPELLIHPKGTAVSGEGGGEARFSAIYAEVPVMLRADLPAVRSVTPILVAGGFGGVKIFERQSVGGTRAQLPVDLDQSFYRRFDAGLTAGAGATYNRLGLTVRYSYGLLDVVQDIEEPPFPDAPRQRPPGDGTSSTWTITLNFGL